MSELLSAAPGVREDWRESLGFAKGRRNVGSPRLINGA
jgi:hypothetical protein